MSSAIKEKGNSVRISIRKVEFISEAEGQVNVVSVTYNIQDKNVSRILDPRTKEPKSQVHVLKRATEDIDASIDPVLEDMVHTVKAVLENHIAGNLGMESEAKGKVVVSGNAFVDKINELDIRQSKDTEEKQLREQLNLPFNREVEIVDTTKDKKAPIVGPDGIVQE